MNKTSKKKTSRLVFQVRCPKEKGFFWGGDKRLAPTMFLQGKGDYVDPGSNFPWGPWGEMD
jgi:hypothetical protein